MPACPSIEHLKPELDPKSELPTEEILREFETKIGAHLPEDYRAFQLRYGGCRVEFEAPILEPTPFGETFTQTRFLRLRSDSDSEVDIYLYLDSQIVPRNMIVIAKGDFGQATCLSFAGIDKGSIYFFDEHQMAFADETHIYYKRFPSVREFIRLRDNEELGIKPPGYDHCYRVADSFSEFLMKCRPISNAE